MIFKEYLETELHGEQWEDGTVKEEPQLSDSDE